MLYTVKTPTWIKKLYPSLIWHQSRREKVLYITFDDGPIPVVTPFVLDELKKYKAQATFFCIGDNICKHPEVYQRIRSEGHCIGNHTHNHLNGWFTPTDDYVSNARRCNELINTKLFRPPYGKIRPTQIKSLKKEFNIIMWDVLSGDFDLDLSPEDCFENVIEATENGSIIVFHDSLKAEPRLRYTLPRALEYWKEKGFSFKGLL